MALRKGLIGAGVVGAGWFLANMQSDARKTQEAPKLKAICTVGPNGKPCNGAAEGPRQVSGVVNFEDDGKECNITYKISGLTPGKHGFHIHEKADFSNGCISAGPHYNPHKVTHGGPEDEVRHVGDLGNVVANDNGIAEGSISDKLIKLSGEYSVIGRSVMVHADVDDLGKGGHELSSTTGNAGARVACGEIKKCD